MRRKLTDKLQSVLLLCILPQIHPLEKSKKNTLHRLMQGDALFIFRNFFHLPPETLGIEKADFLLRYGEIGNLRGADLAV